MPAASAKRDLEITLETALMLDEGKTAIPKLAERIYKAETDLIEEMGPIWIIERLTWMLYRKQQNAGAGNQLPIPGFERLPRSMTLDDGKRPSLSTAKLKDLRKYRAVLARKRDDRLESVDRLIELVSRYNKRKPGITVIEVMVAEKSKLENEKMGSNENSIV